ncbi:hypothetical protein [Alkalicoccus chagannorensis]|uniref:hypothetical protein n=1 Tax=Alkalicoccus chagannorensis TaxID=427072 RepID=UPI00040818C1|nr:hypothetical protein [Alkalicoccus chagannorensis]
MRNCRGAALLEVMAALVITAAAAGIGILSAEKVMHVNQAEVNLRVLLDDLHMLQLEAMRTHKHMVVQFHGNGSYSAYIENELVFSRDPAYPMSFRPGTLSGASVVFRSNGNIPQFGTMKISTGGREYELVFQIGRGRFYIRES